MQVSGAAAEEEDRARRPAAAVEGQATARSDRFAVAAGASRVHDRIGRVGRRRLLRGGSSHSHDLFSLGLPGRLLDRLGLRACDTLARSGAPCATPCVPRETPHAPPCRALGGRHDVDTLSFREIRRLAAAERRLSASAVATEFTVKTLAHPLAPGGLPSSLPGWRLS